MSSRKQGRLLCLIMLLTSIIVMLLSRPIKVIILLWSVVPMTLVDIIMTYNLLLPEDSLGFKTLRLLEEVNAVVHDRGDGAVLVVKDPLQGDSELLVRVPGGHVEAGVGDRGGHLGLFTIIV